jgi:hypothetical protein
MLENKSTKQALKDEYDRKIYTLQILDSMPSLIASDLAALPTKRLAQIAGRHIENDEVSAAYKMGGK